MRTRDFEKGMRHGEWSRLKLSFRDSARIRCPYCGDLITLERHSITDEGSVHPEVGCIREGCGFSGPIRLVGWEA